MRQVIITLCVVCKDGTAIACYDSKREDKKIYCDQCFQESCPPPTHSFSHGFCLAHAKEIRDNLDRRRLNIPVSIERRKT